MNTIVIDIGGTNVKLWRAGATEKFKIPSGKTLGPHDLVDQVREWLAGAACERVSIGYPGDVRHGRPVKDPYNLGPGWIDFDFDHAFACPVRVMNDACMQALGSYEGGRMLYLGLGTSVGTTFVADRNSILPLALGHLTVVNGKRLDETLGRPALKARGATKWSADVTIAADVLRAAFMPDYIVLGGGNAKKVRTLPPGCRRGGNFNAFIGGLRMWEDAVHLESAAQDKPLLLRLKTGAS